MSNGDNKGSPIFFRSLSYRSQSDGRRDGSKRRDSDEADGASFAGVLGRGAPQCLRLFNSAFRRMENCSGHSFMPRQGRRQLSIDDEFSRYPKHRVVGLSGSVLQARPDIFSFQVRIIVEDFFLRSAGSHQIQHVFDADTQPTNARPAAALFRVKRKFDRDISSHACSPFLELG